MMMRSSEMLAGAAFNIYAGDFSLGEGATILGNKPSVLTMRMQRGLAVPERREGGSGTKNLKKGSRRGRVRLSARELTKIQTQQILSDMGFLLKESTPVGNEIKTTQKSAAKRLSAIEAEKIADAVAYKGEWMWAVARAFERGEHLHVYVYASRDQQKNWQFDMKVGERGQPPCFGWAVPHIYLPMSDIFISVYTACKKLLGIATV
jgi:hypothetical protein